jgi:periplasmic copper chaperone A
MRNVLLTGLALTIVSAAPAFAHISLVNNNTSPGANYVASLNVEHGCGVAATIAIRVQIPTGVFNVTAPPKAGWTINLKTSKYPMPFAHKGAQLSEGVIEAAWSGGNLPDKTVTQFVLNVSIADSLKTPTMLFFPVVQECVGGAVNRWIVVPAAGKTAADYEFPAPSVRLIAP